MNIHEKIIEIAKNNFAVRCMYNKGCKDYFIIRTFNVKAHSQEEAKDKAFIAAFKNNDDAYLWHINKEDVSFRCEKGISDSVTVDI